MVMMVMMTGWGITAIAEDNVTVNTGVDFYNRYVWRGLDIANTPSIQPSLSVSYDGFELGTWGAYTLSNEASDADEIDFWLSYTHAFVNGVSMTTIVTDYYFPNAGREIFNFNDYDAVIDDTIPDPGAHTIEFGLLITGPKYLPVTLSGYLNVYNDAGSNSYFQLDYPITVDKTDLSFFCGVAGGSKDNPDYYGTDELAAINLGVTAMREIKMSENFSIPLTVSLVVNPKSEISHILVGMSL
jgi:hypothetical protein